MDLEIKQELSHATHNRVLLGHLGVNFHLVQLLVVEEVDTLYQDACTMEVQLLYAVVRNQESFIFQSFFVDKQINKDINKGLTTCQQSIKQ